MTTARSVRATLNYTVDNGIPPDYYFYEPDPSVKLNPPGTDLREMEIHDAWAQRDALSLDREGFELHEFGAEFREFDSDPAIHERFYPQVIDFVKRHTGARRVVVFDHTIRKRMPADLKVQTEVQRPAVMLVHSDYTPRSGPQRVRDVLPEEADALLARLLIRDEVMDVQRLADDLPDGHARIERTDGVLENHLGAEFHLPRLSPRQRLDVAPIAQNRAFGGWQNARHHAPKRGFATAGFTNQADHFTFAHRQVHAVHRMHYFFAHRRAQALSDAPGKIQLLFKTARNVAQFQHRCGVHAASGASRWGCTQRASRPGRISASKGSVRQASEARRQRDRKAQPGGRFSKDGVMPGICRSASPRLLRLGTEPISPCV